MLLILHVYSGGGHYNCDYLVKVRLSKVPYLLTNVPGNSRLRSASSGNIL